MPKIRWTGLPPSLRQHLFDRVADRQIPADDLYKLKLWRESEPDAPEGPWFKDFGSFKIRGGQWVVVETPSGRVRAQAQISDAILPGVVCCSHGWWEACPELGLPGFDPFSEAGANQNLLVLNDVHDPVSGGTPHRSTLCRVQAL